MASIIMYDFNYSKKLEDEENIIEDGKTEIKDNDFDDQNFFLVEHFKTDNLQCDMGSLMYPLFSLKEKDTKNKRYEFGNVTIDIRVPSIGQANIHDKALWVFVISRYVNALNKGEQISNFVQFTLSEYITAIKKNLGGSQYARMKESLERLDGTRITITTRSKKIENGEEVLIEEAESFGLIERFKYEQVNKKITSVKIEIPLWVYKSVQNNMILSIHKDYFEIKKPLAKRLYEIARKHAGYKKWSFKLSELKIRCGSVAQDRNFKESLYKIINNNEVPEYDLFYNKKEGRLYFTYIGKRKKRIRLNIIEFNKIGKIGEEVFDTLVRCLKEDYIIDKEVLKVYKISEAVFHQARMLAEKEKNNEPNDTPKDDENKPDTPRDDENKPDTPRDDENKPDKSNGVLLALENLIKAQVNKTKMQQSNNKDSNKLEDRKAAMDLLKSLRS